MHDDTPILAIDPSTQAGWALWNPDAKRVTYGTMSLVKKGKSKGHGYYYSEFLMQMQNIIDEAGFGKDLSLRIVMEAPTPGAERSQMSLQLSEGWIAVLKLYCARRKLPEPILVVVNEWRAPFIKHAKKPANLKHKAASDWYKDTVKRRCNEFGFQPKDDNAADALGILRWAKNGGNLTKEQRAEQKKRELELKRAQIKLELPV